MWRGLTGKGHKRAFWIIEMSDYLEALWFIFLFFFYLCYCFFVFFFDFLKNFILFLNFT